MAEREPEVVQYGRRRGALRSSNPKKSACLPTEVGGRVKLREVAVVPAEEWERIQASLSCVDHEAEQQKAQLEARKYLHKTSKTIVSNWENTIEGQRLKKLQARALREKKEEAERMKVDLEEAQYQAERRKEAIERAKTLLYHQTDRVKQFHGALLLTEVLRERDAQVEYRKRREQAVRAQDTLYFRAQEEERERGTLEDIKEAKERAQARDVVARFQLKQIAEKEHLKQREKAGALEEQAELEKETADFHSQQRRIEAQCHSNRLTLQQQLDQSLADKHVVEQRKQYQESAEEEERRVFSEAKKKMTLLRKEKEAELFQEFQQQQTRMCDLLQKQRQQKSSDEDERVARAVAEQEAKREKEEREKEERFLEQERKISQHMREQLAEKRRHEREQVELDQQLLKQRITLDQKFHAQQLERHQKAAREAKELQQFHHTQMANHQDWKGDERKDDLEFNENNMHMLQLEERQFQEYAGKVIAGARGRGAPTQPLQKAAKMGAGGGHGPVFSGKGGIRPSYQVMDSTAVELPSYQPRVSCTTTHSTQKRMGFTW